MSKKQNNIEAENILDDDNNEPWMQVINGNSFFDEGKDDPSQYVKAVEWYKKAADQNYGEGQFNLGHCYEKGLGVEKDYKKAIDLYLKAADNDNVNAMCKLGKHYKEGIIVEQDYEKAVKYLTKAAHYPREHFYNAAQGISSQLLGECYFYGLGVEKDYKKAIKYLDMAVDEGESGAALFLGRLYKEGTVVEKDMKKAVSYFCSGMHNCDFKDSAYEYGLCYLNGEGVEKNINTAYKWISGAAHANCLEAKKFIINCYRTGFIIQRSLGTADRLEARINEDWENFKFKEPL